jgi:hypothetical protein
MSAWSASVPEGHPRDEGSPATTTWRQPKLTNSRSIGAGRAKGARIADPGALQGPYPSGFGFDA